MTTEKRRPWWAAALIGGAAAGATIAAAIGARAEKPDPDVDRLARIEAKVNEIGERVARIEGRLDRK